MLFYKIMSKELRGHDCWKMVMVCSDMGETKRVLRHLRGKYWRTRDYKYGVIVNKKL